MKGEMTVGGREIASYEKRDLVQEIEIGKGQDHEKKTEQAQEIGLIVQEKGKETVIETKLEIDLEKQMNVKRTD